MIDDGELLFDEIGDARGDPKLGGEVELGGRLAQPSQDDQTLLGGKNWNTSAARRRLPPPRSSAPSSSRPSLAAARGDDDQDAARSVDRRSGDAVSQLAARFNAEGLAASMPRHGGGRQLTYASEETARILAEAVRAPAPETWSLSTLQRALRKAPAGLPQVSTYTIRRSGASYRRTGTWCPTGKALRRRKGWFGGRHRP